MNHHFPPEEIDAIATRLANHIAKRSNTSTLSLNEALAQAIVAIYGSLETFYTLIWQFLSSKEAKQLSQRLQEKLTHSKTHSFQEVLQSNAFANIINILKQSGVSGAESVSLYEKPSPNTSNQFTKTSRKGKDSSQNRNL